ncbi:MAG: hypothetical protein FWE89_03265 [Syntrophaceae bacterium]|nr:hypothetical protein [Syntrophaceae bacterium]
MIVARLENVDGEILRGSGIFKRHKKSENRECRLVFGPESLCKGLGLFGVIITTQTLRPCIIHIRQNRLTTGTAVPRRLRD